MAAPKPLMLFHYKMSKQTNIKGFTLIELIVYLAIAATFLVTAIGTGINIITDQQQFQDKREVYSNARLAIEEITKQIQSADDVVVNSSTFNSNPGTLFLDFPGTTNDILIDTYQQSVTIGGLSTTITKLQITEGNSTPIDLTTNQVNVTNFTLENLTRNTEAKNININLTIATTNPGNDPDYDQSISLETAASIRR